MRWNSEPAVCERTSSVRRHARANSLHPRQIGLAPASPRASETPCTRQPEPARPRPKYRMLTPLTGSRNAHRCLPSLWLLLGALPKVTRPQARSAGRNPKLTSKCLKEKTCTAREIRAHHVAERSQPTGERAATALRNRAAAVRTERRARAPCIACGRLPTDTRSRPPRPSPAPPWRAASGAAAG